MKRTLIITISFSLLILSILYFNSPFDANESLFIATTTTVRDSGLLDVLTEDYEGSHDVELKVIVVGTGKALQLGRDGEVDVVLTHAQDLEDIFVEEGYADARYDVMYNDFLLVGPVTDPLGIGSVARENHEEAIHEIMTRIKDQNYPFVSRGDMSGTHHVEIGLWTLSGMEPGGYENYYPAGKGMGDVLIMAEELMAYTLVDRGTYVKNSKELSLRPVYESPENLKNQYGVMVVNKADDSEEVLAEDFLNWLLAEETQKTIGSYGIETYGHPLFIPNGSEK